MKIAYNACFGGFSLSPAATLLLWERGVKEIGTPVGEYFQGDNKCAVALAKWKASKETVAGLGSLFIHVFSPCENFVLHVGRDIARDNAELIRVIEEMGSQANGACACLAIVDIPDDVDWEIAEYDGNETVAEKHRTWP